MLFLPYRVKNPWKHFPYTTVAIIAVNVLVYSLTTESFLHIRDEVVEGYAFQFGVSSFMSLFYAMFLHQDIFHIGGNMLFLWVFGPAVEDRLRPGRYLLVYFATGVVGALLQSFIDTAAGHSAPCIGASGCIMGVMGAYWYLFSWSTVCVFYWIFIRLGVWEIDAFWVIGGYIVIDLAEGFLSSTAGGVANFAHVGGGVSGALLCLALKMKRDTVEVSRVKAEQAELHDLTLLDLPALETLREQDPINTEILRAMIRPAIIQGRLDRLEKAFREAGPTIIDKDPALVATYLLNCHGDDSCYTPSMLVRTARALEHDTDAYKSLRIYQLIWDHHPQSPEIEMVLYRMAFCWWERLQEAEKSRTALMELLKRYPYGSMEPHAKALLRRIGN